MMIIDHLPLFSGSPFSLTNTSSGLQTSKGLVVPPSIFNQRKTIIFCNFFLKKKKHKIYSGSELAGVMALLFAFSFGTKMLFYFLAPRCFSKMQLFHIMVTSYCSLHFLLALFQDATVPSPLFTPNTAGRCWRYLWTRSESWLRTFLSLSLSSKIPYQPYRPIYFQFEVNWLFLLSSCFRGSSP